MLINVEFHFTVSKIQII